MKILAILFLLILPIQLFASSDSTSVEILDKRQAMLEKLSVELSLSATQKERVEQVLIKRSKAIKKLKSNKEVAKDQKQDRLKLINNKTKVELASILDEDQFDTFLSLREELGKARQEAYKNQKRKFEDDELDL
ncbi:hypothetical protein N7E81_01600 [Reichenbachiella carrageenanivorans]|uniref:LTXXQ motif family protein n=1 Tax=Reichenbachiella carrageenanivorans TaxID=2979869 RepID=A0ABY6D2F7_9BACT|nr:hypothetical protein [Reichenbachiella carrageenanivorans]UXX79800.1 hypothetical protein N7E81_01600 [Reichenbachiella carrageenanivorans]